jgi:UDP-2,3-diacylglucosamine pyrophosphatase LpxH
MSHQCADGRRLLVTHGDCIGSLTRSRSFTEQFGGAAYRRLVEADARFNRLRRRLGQDYSSLSTAIKLRLKSANDYIDRFEETAARHASSRGFDGIVCGHIHCPRIRQIDGTFYANDGDWVEHRTALGETTEGQLQLLRWSTASLTAEPAPRQAPIAA